MLTVRIAGLVIGIENKYRHVEHLVRDYLTPETPEFTVSATEADIERERAASEGDFSPGYLESTVVYRKIAERLPAYGAFVFHGAVISVDGGGYAFTARSGVGKTTHTRLWLAHYGERAHYVNGDKPIIRLIDGVPYAFGTPWMGKENYGSNTSVPLLGIAHLMRGEVNSARVVSADELSEIILSQMFIPKERAMALRTLSLLNSVLSSVRLIELRCNMDSDAPLAPARAFGIAE